MNSSILLIYTGGTIGMKQDPDTLALVPFNFDQITQEVPELKKFGYTIDSFFLIHLSTHQKSNRILDQNCQPY